MINEDKLIFLYLFKNILKRGNAVCCWWHRLDCFAGEWKWEASQIAFLFDN